ncbi:MAG: PAS domain-containing protein [Pseudanabaenaceae cyanobacterium SKYGB_i_bin29]|nr:PAS domain-containing protein [Pseudanabaenaceae cyanobacterium SKYG29]MDW8420635.1 PAS domain-containing protein [Pseudanabaenaceae cyanobacterium SKYGB_i_bin29]
MPDPIVHPQQPLIEVARILHEQRLSYVEVVEGGAGIGFISQAQIVQVVADRAEAISTLTARDVMVGMEQIIDTCLENITLSTIAKHYNDIVVVLDREGRFTYCHPCGARILGFTKEEVIGQSAFGFIHSADLEITVQTFTTALGKPNEPVTTPEYRMLDAHGKWRYFAATIINLLDHPIIRGVVVICQDITDRKQKELELVQQVRKNQIIAEMVQLLYQSSKLIDVFQHATFSLRQLLEVDSVNIVQYFPDRYCWQSVTESLRNDSIPSLLNFTTTDAASSFAPQILRREIVQITDTRIEGIDCPRAEIFPGAWLIVPIVVSDSVWGAVCLGFYQTGHTWQPEEIEVVQLAIKQLAIAIEEANLLEELMIGRERLRLALEFSEVGCWEFSFNGGDAVWSDSLFHLMDLDPQIHEPCYDTWRNLVHPDDLAWVEQEFQKTITEKATLDIIYRIVMPTGKVRWVLTKGRAVYRDDQPEKILGVMIDITDRKELELALAQSQEKLNLVLKLNKIGIWEWDLVNSQVSWNEQKYELLGLSYDTKPSYDAFIQLVAPEQREEIESRIRYCIDHQETYYHETKIITPSGVTRWLQEQGECEVKDGRVVRLLGIAQDITQRKLMELELIDSETRYRSIVENIPGVIMHYVLDKYGRERITYVSPRSRELFEISADEILENNQLFWQLFSPEDRTLFHGSIIYSAQTQRQWNREYPISTPSGHIKWIQGIGTPQLQPSGDILWRMIILDVTARKLAEHELEQEKQFNAQITQLTSAIIYLYDATRDSIHLLNTELVNILSLNPGNINILDQNLLTELIHPQDLPALINHWQNIIIDSVNSDKKIEFRITDCWGNWYWLLASHRVFTTDASGRPTQILGVAVDITKQKETEAELRESEQRFQHLASNIPGVIMRYIVHTDGTDTITYISPGCEQIFGKTDREIINNDRIFWNCIVAEDLPKLYGYLLACSQKFQQWKCEWRIKTNAEQVKWLSGLGSPQQLPNGDVLWDVIILDITGKKQAEQEVKEQQELLKQVVESSSSYIYVYDLEERRNVYASPAVESILGYSAAEMATITEQRILELIHPEDHYVILNASANIDSKSDADVIELEYRVRDKQGNWHWLFDRGRIIKRNKDGLPKHFLGVATDVTKLKEAEASLQRMNQELEGRVADRTRALEERLQQELLLRTIIENIYQSFDLEQIFNITLREIRHSLECDRVAIYKFNPDGSGCFLTDSHAEELETIAGQVMEIDTYSPQSYGVNLDNPHVLVVNDFCASTGSNFYLLEGLELKASLASAIYVQNQLWGALVVYEHRQSRTWKGWEVNLIQQIAMQLAMAIQRTELYEQIQSELKEKEVLLKEVHHRVKNNLQIMSSLLRMQFRTAPSEIRQQLEDYQTRIQAMALVHDQLYRATNFSSINLQSYLTKLVNCLLQTFVSDATKVKIEVDAQEIILPLEKSIPLGLLTNELVSNCFKYAFPNGVGVIKVTLSAEDEFLILQVEDNGVGLPPDFDIETSDSLGMQLVLTLVEQLEGTLHYQTGAGTVFTVRFPHSPA